jgi:replicative DNA helicase
MADQKAPPANLLAEQALLGLVLRDNDIYRRTAVVVERDHFSDPAHRMLWDIFSTLVGNGSVANSITCRPHMNGMQLNGSGDEYLKSLIDAAPSSINAIDYAQQIRALAIRREMINIADSISEQCFNAPAELSAEKIFSQFEAMMGEVRPTVKAAPDYMDFDHVLDQAAQYASDSYRDAGLLRGLSTGMPRLDNALGGLQPGDLIILGGRPGMGKTALATNIAYSVGRELKRRREENGDTTGVVAFHSLEMTAEQLGQRVLAEVSGVPFWRIRRNIVEPEEIQRFVEAKHDIPRLPVHVDATPNLTVATLRMRLRGLKKRFGLEIAVVDYLQLLSGNSQKKDFNRAAEVTEITTALKNIAKELNIPLIALSQLSRRVEERPDKRPKLADLRESGSIEQDADVVMFVYRHEYYLRQEKPREGTDAFIKWEAEMARIRGVAEVIVEKNRHGPVGEVTLGFVEQITKFVNDPPENQAPAGGSETGEQRPREIKIAGKAANALGILRSLWLNDKQANDNLANVPGAVKWVVSYTRWRECCAEQLLDIGRDDKAIGKLMEEVITPLKAGDLIGRGGVKGSPWVWFTPKGEVWVTKSVK